MIQYINISLLDTHNPIKVVEGESHSDPVALRQEVPQMCSQVGKKKKKVVEKWNHHVIQNSVVYPFTY